MVQMGTVAITTARDSAGGAPSEVTGIAQVDRWAELSLERIAHWPARRSTTGANSSR
jgi:hypothetical protein